MIPVRCRLNAGPASPTLARHWGGTGRFRDRDDHSSLNSTKQSGNLRGIAIASELLEISAAAQLVVVGFFIAHAIEKSRDKKIERMTVICWQHPLLSKARVWVSCSISIVRVRYLVYLKKCTFVIWLFFHFIWHILNGWWLRPEK